MKLLYCLSLSLTELKNNLFSFFLRMEGSRELGKKFLRISTGSSVKTKYKLDFWWEKISLHGARFFPAERLSTFSDRHKTQFKSADPFCPETFSRQKTSVFFFQIFFWAIPKKYFNHQMNKYLPFSLCGNVIAPFKSANFNSLENIVFFFRRDKFLSRMPLRQNCNKLYFE